MRIIFYDVKRETYASVDNVVQLNSYTNKINGRYTSVWYLHLSDGGILSYPQKWFKIERIET